MKSRLWTAIFAGFALAVGTASAAPPTPPMDMGIITGGDKGTYYQFGLNLKRLVAPHGVNLTVVTSKGSVENVFAVYHNTGTKLGIVTWGVVELVGCVET